MMAGSLVNFTNLCIAVLDIFSQWLSKVGRVECGKRFLSLDFQKAALAKMLESKPDLVPMCVDLCQIKEKRSEFIGGRDYSPLPGSRNMLQWPFFTF